MEVAALRWFEVEEKIEENREIVVNAPSDGKVQSGQRGKP